MKELRYILRGVARTLNRRLSEPLDRRTTVAGALGFLVGVFGYLLTKSWLPPTARNALWLLAAAALATWGVWWGVRSGKRVWTLYQWASKRRLIETEQFWLNYDAELEPLSHELLSAAQRALNAAERFLQTPLDPAMRIVYIYTSEDVRFVYPQRDFGGQADTTWDSIIAVYHGDMETTYRTLLHEWAHLIAARWYEHAPTLFMEGVAVATQHHDNPLQAHTDALYYLHYYPNRSILSIMQHQAFYQEDWQYAHYAWAGSFTLYWIEQGGLPRFRRFYHRLVEQSVEEAFQAEYELSLGQAELLWREYLHTELPEPSRLDALRRALHDTLRWAVYELNDTAIEALANRVRCERPDYWMGYYGQGICKFWQGDLEGALECFEQANAAPVQDETDFRGRAWCECGFIYDLLGRREQAVQCYQRALEYPDYEDPAHAYHARARQHLETPYTYEARYRFLKGD
ncbi:MAG: tetratricopeptide repeat protein [Fimbriimonadales bacterium]|nr:tetratricopeptide repeat protein [Fimbriimonadales bacterium]